MVLRGKENCEVKQTGNVAISIAMPKTINLHHRSQLPLFMFLGFFLSLVIFHVIMDDKTVNKQLFGNCVLK